jgi:hypothetical protein
LQTRRTSVVPGAEGLSSPRFAPDGNYISAVSAKDFQLMLFDIAGQKWAEQGPKDTGWQCWSKDSKYVYFPYFIRRPDVVPTIFRVAVHKNKPERILSLKDFRLTGDFGASFSLHPTMIHWCCET